MANSLESLEYIIDNTYDECFRIWKIFHVDEPGYFAVKRHLYLLVYSDAVLNGGDHDDEYKHVLTEQLYNVVLKEPKMTFIYDGPEALAVKLKYGII